MRERIYKAEAIALAWMRTTIARALRYLARSSVHLRPIPWRALFRTAFPLWLTTRLLGIVITYVSRTMLRASVVQAPCKGTDCVVSLNNIIVSWRFWDGGFFGHILNHGYDQPIDAAFWPLYPLLTKPLEMLLGPTRWQIALLVTSNLATFAAFVLLGALAIQEDETLGAARRTMTLVAAAPLALFLTAAYSDSLFLALACATLLCARRGQWRAAALWACLATFTRPTGVILIAPLLYEFGRQMGWPIIRWRTRRRWLPTAVMLLGAVLLAVEIFSFYCWRVYNDPFAWLHAEAQFHHQAMAPWGALGYAWRQFWHLTPGSFQQARGLIDDIPLLFVLGFTLATIRRIPAV